MNRKREEQTPSERNMAAPAQIKRTEKRKNFFFPEPNCNFDNEERKDLDLVQTGRAFFFEGHSSSLGTRSHGNLWECGGG